MLIFQEILIELFFEHKILKGFSKTIMAFYISGIMYALFVENSYNYFDIIKILFFIKIPGFSEFLVSFALMYLVVYIFKNIFSKMGNITIIILILISLLFTLIDYQYISVPIVGSIIGTTDYSCFPIIQYFGYYLFGLYIAKNKIIFNKIIFILCFLCSWFVLTLREFNLVFLRRFPPSLYWVIGAAFFVYFYYIIFKYINSNKFTFFIEKIGKNSLNYLLISNVVIFVSYRLIIYFDILFNHFWVEIVFYLFIFILSIFISSFYNYVVVYRKK